MKQSGKYSVRKLSSDSPPIGKIRKKLQVQSIVIFCIALCSTLVISFLIKLFLDLLDNPQLITNSNTAENLYLSKPAINVRTFYSLVNGRHNFPQLDDYSARSIAILDIDANKIIFQKNAEQRVPIASLTKMVTTKVLYDNSDLNEHTSINEESEKYTGSSLVLKKGDTFTNRDLIKAAIIVSNNQATYAIIDPEKLVDMSNAYVRALQLENTNVSNPAGFDDNGKNYSTAADLLLIAKVFFDNPELKEFAGMTKTDIHELSSNKIIRITNTNELLGLNIPYVIAGKTGTTELAGQNLCLLLEKNSKRYIVIILGSKERYNDAFKIIDRLP